MKPRFITLDGIDGAGKSTNLAVMKAWFEKHKLPVLFTREPGGTPAGEALREILLNPATQVSLRTETLLMFAARQQHLETVILPALKNGTHVVSDRFTDATFAYQGGGRGVPLQDIATLEHWVQGDFRPDLTLLLDVPLEVSMARINQTREKDRFEQEAAEFLIGCGKCICNVLPNSRNDMPSSTAAKVWTRLKPRLKPRWTVISD